MSSSIEYPLRYKPEHGDFVCINGRERFNRPIYCANSSFRVDGGDVPVFALFLPGRGGNLRFAIKAGESFKWLDEAPQIEARYRPGSLLYKVGGLTPGEPQIELSLLPIPKTTGFLVKAELIAGEGCEFYCAFGGAEGGKGSRNIDIGCEKGPVREVAWFRPEWCKDNSFDRGDNGFTLKCSAGNVVCQTSDDFHFTVVEGNDWGKEELFEVKRSAPSAQVEGGHLSLKRGQPVYLRFEKSEKSVETKDWAKLFDQCESARKEIANHITVDTPDEFINAAVPALCVASDGTWDEKQSAFMHGAVAWRIKLLGWRGAYAGDALGWHDRTRRHLGEWFSNQNTNPIPETMPSPEPESNLARNENALHTNGDMSRNHYDMQLVGVDAFFRHLLWTGDLEYAKSQWPVIERHLAWERRLFRREYTVEKTGEKLPLYEGYCCFWASDDVAYNGGGATHSSAYNYYHNKMAAKVAKLIGKDGSQFEKEAELILRGMNEFLWSKSQRTFGEWRDLLGLKQLHEIPAVWSIYHTIDSECTTPEQALAMTNWVDSNIAQIPLKGKDVPEGFYTIPSSNWMPYTWSTNNVVMAEVAHTSLAYFQSGRADDAYRLLKGAILDSMYTGLCPGNVGMCTKFDVSRRESQRDFADGCGTLSRTIIEGLFGLKPDMLSGVVKLEPGFPRNWDHATLNHPDFTVKYTARDKDDVYVVESRLNRTFVLKLVVNGKEIQSEKAVKHSIKAPKRLPLFAPIKVVSRTSYQIENDEIELVVGKYETIDLTKSFNDNVTQIFKNEYLSPRSPFCSLALPKQGYGSWCKPKAMFDVDDSGLRKLDGKVVIAPGVEILSPAQGKNILFTSQWDNYPHEASVDLSGNAKQVVLMVAGSTNAMQSRFDNGEVVVTYQDGTSTTLKLHNPTTWWPIDQDYLIDDYAFKRPEPLPIRVDLKTGLVRQLKMEEFKGKGKVVPGGAATVLTMKLDSSKQLKSLTVRALANEVVVGLMGVTLQRE